MEDAMAESYAEIARAEALFHAAYEHQLRGEFDRAEDLYRRSISAHPTAESHTFLGWVMSLQGRYLEAIEECKAAIRLDPEFGNPYNDIGAYCIELGRHSEACEWLKRAIDAPRYGARHFPHVNLGRVYEVEGEWADALAEYGRALKLSPGFTVAQQAIVRLRARLN